MYFLGEFLYIFSFGMWPWQCGQAKDDESFGFGDCQRDCHFRSSLICIIHLFSTVLRLSSSTLSISAKWPWPALSDNLIMMTRLYEGTSASDTFDGRCVGHRLKVNFPPSWQKEFQIYSLKMKTHLEISNCRRNQAILYRLLTIRSNLP